MVKEKTKDNFQQSLDELKKQIQAIQTALRKMRESGLNEDVLCTAVQKCANRFYHERYSKPISVRVVKAILKGIDNLEEYLFPPPPEEQP